MQPLEIRPVGDTEILVNWLDGHRSLFTSQYLRLNCPCAGCRDEWSGKRLISLDKIPHDIKPLQMVPVGRYAVRFNWSDRHDTGIYGFDFLRSICSCQACQVNRGPE